MCLVGVWCALMTLAFYALSFPFNHHKSLSWAFAQALNFGVRIATGIRVAVIGQDNMIPGPAVIIMNHQSNFDPLLQGPVFQKNTVIIGKKEIRKFPLWGRLFKATNNIMVDRSAKGKNGSAVDLAVERLTTDDCYIWIFPEGTRSHGKAMNPFKDGAFRMAIRAQVPIIPMVTKPLKTVLDTTNRIAKGGDHEIKILEPISTIGLTEMDVSDLKERCKQLYRDHLSNYLKISASEVFAEDRENI